MRALVTGAAGFIGSHLCERLVGDGHEVVGLDDLSTGSEANLRGSPEVDLLLADLREAAAVEKAMRGCEVVFHHGARTSVQRSMQDPGLTGEVNVIGTLNVLLAAREARPRVVFASSSSAYGDQERYPLVEELEPRPKSPYAASKLAAEYLCHTWWRSFGVPTICFRYFNVYGPRQDPESEYAAVIPRFFRACLSGVSPEIHGDGEQARDFTYVDDVIQANLLAAGAPEQAYGITMNVGAGREPTSINRLLALIGDLSGSRPQAVHVPPRPGDIRLSHADVSRAERLIGYRPSVDIEEGLRRTYEHFVRLAT
jgi:nucleoside-diphosphate-sugar epimerase